MTLELGAYAPPAPHTSLTAVIQLERLLGRRLDLVHFFQAWGGGHRAFRKDWLDRASGRGRRVMLSWEPWVPGGPVDQPAYSLERILAGAYDPYVWKWAKKLAAYRRPVFLRPMHEMNFPCYPWSQGVGGNGPESFVAAWRHLHGIFAAADASNVRWVWCPLADDPPGAGMEAFYPGSRYVDVLALDGYNWGSGFPQHGGWRSFRRVFCESYRRVERLDRTTPIWIAETASDTRGGDKASWIDEMFRTLATDMPRVELIGWFNEKKEREWPLGLPPAAAQAMARGLARS